MSGDFGIRISPRVQRSPLWRLSPRALRLWMFLAMKGQHAAFTRELRDGQRVSVAWGQLLTSSRMLQKDVEYRSPKAVIADLSELETAGAITTKRVTRQRFQNGNASASESETPERFQNGNAGYTVATLVTVHGISQLRESSASKSETKRSTYLTEREQAENAKALAAMAEEGR